MAIITGTANDDRLEGGADADLLTGAAGADTLSGLGGGDELVGGAGDDTIEGGAGADTFHVFGEAGVDRILDFSAGEGDRVRVEAGYTWTTAQIGSDVVVSVSGGATVTLVGVTLSALGDGWIVGG